MIRQTGRIQTDDANDPASGSGLQGSDVADVTGERRQAGEASAAQPSRTDRLVLAFLWLLFGISLAGAAIEWMFLDRSPWPGIGAACTIAGVAGLTARVKGIPPWPWRRVQW